MQFSGFKKTGIHPVNADIFPDWMFAASLTTDIPEQNDPELQTPDRDNPPNTPPPPSMEITERPGSSNISNITPNKENILDNRIYNVDETGISTVPKETSKRLGVKQFGIISSWERRKNITVIAAFSASGNYIPPLFVFPRKRMSPYLQKNGPSGAIYTCTDNGWSNENVFSLWLKHFQNKV
ncbi:hypothetical protein PPYR_02336 [Photinus pyralis]|uniref:DDE-1 domain-containing protein n=1 Tax=Photinus pyralis TaxID=7054 RepID=A0A5N4B722_PHOPY|nr:hypothetical protein PPYR_02336 [Photinus pyralis]